MRFFFLFLLVVVLVAGCDDSSESNNTNNVNNSNNTNNTNNVNNTNNTTAPDFVTPVADPSIQFELRGVINSYDQLVNGTSAQAIGAMKIFDDGVETYYTERPVITDYVLPDGTELIVLTALGPYTSDTQPHENHLQSGTYATIYIYLPKENLLAVKDAGEDLLYGELIGALLHVRTQYFQRNDGALFYRRCNSYVMDHNEQSVVQVEMESVTDFEQGELIVARGNVAVSDDFDVIVERSTAQVEDNGEMCLFIIDGVYVERSVFYEELYGDLTLDCELPETFFTTDATESITGLFSGEIVEYVGNGSEQGGRGSFALTLAGGPVAVADMNRFAALENNAEGNLIHFVLMGDYQVMSASHVSLNFVTIDLFQEALITGTASGLNMLEPDALASMYVYNYEYKEEDGGSRYMICPTAVPLDATGLGDLALCKIGSEAFAVGDPFQLAINIPLSSDASEIAALYGESMECTCVENDVTIDCSEF